MTTLHHDRFLEFAAPQHHEWNGESVTYTPLSGTPRTVNVMVHRNPPEPLPGVPNAQGKFLLISCRNLNPAQIIAGGSVDTGIGSDEVNTGGDTITVAERIGATATARPIKRIVSQAGGMLTLEVR